MKTIYLHMLKKWGGSKPGEIVAFGEPKGRRVIAAGFAEEVPAPKSHKKQSPVVETATAKPKAERAEVTPVIPKSPVEKVTVDPVKAKKDEADAKADTKGKKKGG